MSLLCRFSFLIVLLSGQSAVAQWGVQGTIFHHEQMTGRHGLHWTIGFAHDVTDRSSIGIDLIGHLDLMGDGNFSEETQYAGYTVGYLAQRKVIGVQYRSTFFLGPFSSGVYLGPYIGFRSISRPFLVNYVYSSSSSVGSDNPAWARSSTTSAMIFPIGLRFGFRSDMDGYFGDFYVGIGSQLGSGNEEKVPIYINQKDKLKGLSFQVGYSAGLGW